MLHRITKTNRPQDGNKHSLLLMLADSLVAAILWSCITYYPVGLAPEASRFFTFVLILFVVHSMVRD